MTRGVDQLSDWTVAEDAGSRERRLHLRCTNDVATQVERRLSEAIIRRLPYRPADRGEWTHRYTLARQLDEKEVAFLEMLTRLLTLRLGEPLRVALALDYYKDATSNANPALWVNTPVGELVNRGKYGDSDQAGRELALALAAVIGSHPDLGLAEVVVSMPSHSARRFSERLGAAVGRIRGLSVITLSDDQSTPLKETTPEDRPPSEFTGDLNAIRGKAILIVDDVTRTGESLRRLATELKRAGAESISALVGVRTMRN